MGEDARLRTGGGRSRELIEECEEPREEVEGDGRGEENALKQPKRRDECQKEG